MPGLSKEVDIVFRLQGLMDSSFRQSTSSAKRRIEELEKALQEVNSRGDIADLRQDADQADQSFSDLQKSAGAFRDTLKSVAKFTGIPSAADSFKKMVGSVGDFENGMAQLQASTGASAAEMQAMEKIAEDLYKMPMGDRFDVLSEAIGKVRQVTLQSGGALEETTKNALIFRNVFKGEITESVQTVDTMMRNFGITSTESFNLLAQGAQKGLNNAGGLLNSVKEYAPQFAALGYSANEMFDMFSAGLASGGLNLEKVGAAAEKFNSGLQEGSKTTSDAMAVLFAPDHIVEWTNALTQGGKKSSQYMELVGKVGKKTGEQMVANLRKGSKTASETFTVVQSVMGEGQHILDGLSEGSIKGKDAMNAVILRLQEIKDPLERNQLGVALFGTQFKDLETNVVAAMGTTRNQFDMAKATMDEVAKVKYDTIGKDFQTIGRQLMTELVIPIAEDLMPALGHLADWATDNSEVVQALALVVPAALIGKNVYKLVQGIGQVAGAAAGAAGAAGSFGGAIALLTNPVGLAIGGVAALTLGVMAYKQHQENVRQDLIHMGDDLDAAAQRYQAVADKAKQTNDLVWEYNNLSTAVQGNTDNTEQLVSKKERLADITKQLQDMYPKIITQYDIENDKIKEKLGLLKQESDADRAYTKLKLEREVADKSRDQPKLEKEYQKLKEQAAEADSQRSIIDSTLPVLKEYQVEFHKLLADEPTEQTREKLDALQQKINEAAEVVGLHFNHLADFDAQIKKLEDKRVDAIDAQLETQDELRAASSSYQELYDAQKSLIELNLGGSLEEQAKNFNSLPDEQKSRFMEALAAINELNRQMDLLPFEKKINVDVLYQSSGLEQPPGTGSKPLIDSPDAFKLMLPDAFELKLPEAAKPPYAAKPPETFRPPFLRTYADGGFANTPSIFGEAGPEIAIPLNDKPRSHTLLDMANRMMGRGDSNQVETNITWAPSIVIQGGDPGIEQKMRGVLSDSQAGFEQFLKQRQERRERVSLR
ncbi:phage tail tape measure protein [Cohnella nanjingensis]|uniref:Phage tail tape measure protein n=1 Tax=Cohnella nanjingensis TaxID=1387779 RepID=A0A7X0RN91_9BACL|nr:phage tail tape measure protein [Cohnella nanjingensis]MBB6670506.1 phage tail tape measure protein [Cohnella nanjingensis]